MRKWQSFVFICIFLFQVYGLAAQVPMEDSIRFQTDSAIVSESDATVLFFQEGEKVSRPEKIQLQLLSKKTSSLAAFFKTDEMMYPDHVLFDLDKDGKKELLITNFTGGAHCCDEIFIFKQKRKNKYEQVAKLFAGNTLITTDHEFLYDFHEQFGYFFTCFACGFSSPDGINPVEVNHITLRYTKGKMEVIPGTEELKQTIFSNLQLLTKQSLLYTYKDLLQDDGLRKEIALNLVVYYFSFGKNISATQQLFSNYYHSEDHDSVWQAFVNKLEEVLAESNF